MPVSQRFLPMSRPARSCSAASSLRTSTRVNLSSASCSQYQSEVRPRSAGAPAAGWRRGVTLRVAVRVTLRVALRLPAEREVAMAPSFPPTANLLDAYPFVQLEEVRWSWHSRPEAQARLPERERARPVPGPGGAA